jgi:hypothetical protein
MRPARSVLLLLTLAAGIGASLYSFRNRWSSQGTIVRGDGFEGLILLKSRFMRDDKSARWMVTPADIVDFERALRDTAQTRTNAFPCSVNTLPDYYRQYHAWVAGPRRILTAEFFHRDTLTRCQWLHRTPALAATGPRNWRVTYYPDRSEFTDIRANP